MFAWVWGFYVKITHQKIHINFIVVVVYYILHMNLKDLNWFRFLDLRMGKCVPMPMYMFKCTNIISMYPTYKPINV